MMTSYLKKIDHINIVVENLEEVKRFFISFGFQIEDQSRLQGEWISKIVGLKDVDAEYIKMTLPGDSTSLELIQFRKPSAVKTSNSGEANIQGYRHMAFQVSDIEKAVSFLKDQGIEPVSSIQKYSPTNKKLVYFRGPEDILLELAQYGNARI
ncbi:MAG: VOC family protein [Thermodesulfobacteriota bacterium]|nr:VOC family protein [Thermodesulfobacteriota bacterium]